MRSAISTKLILACLAIVFGLMVVISPLGGALDNVAYDLNFLLRGPDLNQQQVVVVAIDEASFQEIGKPWPWPRSLHAKLLDSLFAAGAKAVVLDLILADPSTEVEDNALANALSQAGPVVLATDVERTTNVNFERLISVQPLPRFLTDNVIKGYAGLPMGSDGFVRNFGHSSVSGEADMARAAVAAYAPSLQGRQTLTGTVGINFAGPVGHITQVSYYQALAADQFLVPNTLQGKLVLVGLVTQSELLEQSSGRDSYLTPYTRWGSAYMNGVEIHANAVQSLLLQNQIRYIGFEMLVVISLLIALLCWWFMNRYPPNITLVPVAILFLAIAAISYWLFVAKFYYTSWPLLLLPAVFIYLSSPVMHYLLARQQRNFIHKAFSSYVSKDVVNQLMDSPELLKLGGTTKTGSILFLDLEGFTSLSERLSPVELLDVLNRYLGGLSEIAIAEGGMVDKFIGDCIMVVWGAPIDDSLHAERACCAALKMQQYIQQMGEQQASNGKVIRARIGINSGEFVAGNIGGSKKLDYTVLGDTVNLASRLEGINKLYSSSIIISEHTATQLDGQFNIREIDWVRVKGKSRAARIFELIALVSEKNTQQQLLDKEFQQARSFYTQGQFKSAVESFAQILEQRPDDTVCKALAARCREFEKTPPLNWQGIYRL